MNYNLKILSYVYLSKRDVVLVLQSSLRLYLCNRVSGVLLSCDCECAITFHFFSLSFFFAFLSSLSLSLSWCVSCLKCFAPLSGQTVELFYYGITILTSKRTERRSCSCWIRYWVYSSFLNQHGLLFLLFPFSSLPQGIAFLVFLLFHHLGPLPFLATTFIWVSPIPGFRYYYYFSQLIWLVLAKIKFL